MSLSSVRSPLLLLAISWSPEISEISLRFTVDFLHLLPACGCTCPTKHGRKNNKVKKRHHAAINISPVLREVAAPLYVAFNPFCVHSVHKIGAVNIRTFGDFNDFSSAMLDFGQRYR